MAYYTNHSSNTAATATLVYLNTRLEPYNAIHLTLTVRKCDLNIGKKYIYIYKVYSIDIIQILQNTFIIYLLRHKNQ